MIKIIVNRIVLPVLITGFIVGCASSGSEQYQRSRDNTPDFEPSLNSETGLNSKKERIEHLREELLGIRLQIEERNKMLEGLKNIRKQVGSDSLDNSSAY